FHFASRGSAIAPPAVMTIAPIAVLPIPVAMIVAAPMAMVTIVAIVVAVMVAVADAHINAGRLRRRRGDRSTGHQRCGQHKTCKNLLHICSPDSALSHQS